MEHAGTDTHRPCCTLLGAQELQKSHVLSGGSGCGECPLAGDNFSCSLLSWEFWQCFALGFIPVLLPFGYLEGSVTKTPFGIQAQ